MIEIKFTGNDLDILKNEMRGFIGNQVAKVEVLDTNLPDLVDSLKEAAGKKVTKKKAKKAKAEVVESEGNNDIALMADITGVDITTDETYAALQKVSSEKNLDTARDVLKEFDCARISELGRKDYKKFVDHCEKVCGA